MTKPNNISEIPNNLNEEVMREFEKKFINKENEMNGIKPNIKPSDAKRFLKQALEKKDTEREKAIKAERERCAEIVEKAILNDVEHEEESVKFTPYEIRNQQ